MDGCSKIEHCIVEFGYIVFNSKDMFMTKINSDAF